MTYICHRNLLISEGAHCLRSCTYFPSFNPFQDLLEGSMLHAHFTDEETETQGLSWLVQGHTARRLVLQSLECSGSRAHGLVLYHWLYVWRQWSWCSDSGQGFQPYLGCLPGKTCLRSQWHLLGKATLPPVLPPSSQHVLISLWAEPSRAAPGCTTRNLTRATTAVPQMQIWIS